MKMKLQSIILITLLGCLVAASPGDEDASGQPQQEKEIREAEVEPSARANFVMPKLFDFELFKEKFDKHYANAAELARRMKLFTARAFAVFISGIKYKYGKAKKYLKLNPFSDWTLEERRAISNHRLGRRGPKSSPDVTENKDHGPMPAVESKDVERVLAEISEHRDEDPSYAAIDAELKRVNRRRKKRNATPESISSEPTPRRNLSMDDLAGGRPVTSKIPAKYASWVPSNNPDYERPEHDSQGVDDDVYVIHLKPIPAAEAKRIDDEASRGGYLNMLVASIKGAVDYILPPDQEAQIQTPERNKYSLHLADESTHEEESEADSLDEDEPNDLPDEVFFDYRDYGCLLEPKSQLDCGSCYIFATTALMEFHHCMQRDKLVPFSEQYTLDCGYRINNKQGMDGCEGGLEATVGEFVAKYGLELEKDYPYTGEPKSCPYDPETKAKHMGHSRLEMIEAEDIDDENPRLTQETIQYLLEEKGPLYIGLNHTNDFFDFAGGVDEPRCDLEGIGGHAMVLVGHGREDGLEYWLIRNSHGPEYGFEGHYKISKKAPKECFIGVGYVRGTFKKNKTYKGKKLFSKMKIEAQLAEANAAPAA